MVCASCISALGRELKIRFLVRKVMRNSVVFTRNGIPADYRLYCHLILPSSEPPRVVTHGVVHAISF